MGERARTPTPWMIDPDSPLDILLDDRDGENVMPIIGCVFDANTDEAQAEADAAFIVRAVNAHDELVEALPDLSHVISWLDNGCDPKQAAVELRIYKERIDAALSRHGEGK